MKLDCDPAGYDGPLPGARAAAVPSAKNARKMLQAAIGGLMLAAGMLIAGDVKAAADPATGEAIFNRTCQNCHSIHIGVNKVGPSLYHVIGRKAGSVPGFEYSEAMKDSGQTWTPEELNVYLSNPRGTLHGVKMFFQGLNLESQRLDVIAYLQSLQ